GHSAPGIVVSFYRTGKTKNTVAPGSWKAYVAVADSAGRIAFPVTALSKKEPPMVRVHASMEEVMPEFSAAMSDLREGRYIVTGNILAGFSKLERAGGKIVFFTDDQGKTRRGVLMPKLFNPD